MSFENTVGKGKIGRNEQCLLLPQCFQKASTADTKKPGLVWERFRTGKFQDQAACSVLPDRDLQWLQSVLNRA